MDLQLKGQHALVTGSTAGIGYAIAHALAAEGATVTVNGRSEASVGKALARLRAELPGASLRGIAADAATAEGCAKLVAGGPAVDILATRPLGLRGGTLTGLVVLIMTWVVAPQLTRGMKPWLHKH